LQIFYTFEPPESPIFDYSLKQTKVHHIYSIKQFTLYHIDSICQVECAYF